MLQLVPSLVVIKDRYLCPLALLKVQRYVYIDHVAASTSNGSCDSFARKGLSVSLAVLLNRKLKGVRKPKLAETLPRT